MIIEIDGRRVDAPKKVRLNNPGGPLLAVIAPDEADDVFGQLGLPELAEACRLARSSKLESRDGYDFITVFTPSDAKDDTANPGTCICACKDALIFVSAQPAALYEVVSARRDGGNSAMLDRFFDALIAADFDRLEAIEEDISALEEAITERNRVDNSGEIMRLRRIILQYKNYYERLYGVADDIVDNENGLYSKTDLKNFRITRDRVDRLRVKALNLQEQITQVREAYQSQLDISLNKTMKVLTVVTSLFLPLTLLVGWYGMNLQMPEFNWPWGYPFVILLSVLLVVVLLIIFKKEKWF